MDGNETIKTKEYLRAPIVTVMGHVDHGKTSILDAFRHTDIQSKEHGGITQHIGAYQIEHNSHKITFIDTPGHEAFAQMRVRGSKAADIVVLVVSAEESVKPQTQEAIRLAQATKTPMIVAINKIDLPGANIPKVKQDLANEGVLTEDWGGDVLCVEVSAKQKTNLDKLLDAIIAVSELQRLTSDPLGESESIIIEARLDRRKGVVTSCIVKNGSLDVGDKVVASGQEATIKSIMDDKGTMLKHAGPSTPVEILGFKEVPNVGDLIVEHGSDLAELSINEDRMEIVGKNAKKTVAIVVRADTQGTLEAVKAGLAKLVTSSVGSTFSLKFLLSATGDLTESDVMLAGSAKGVIVGFNVRLNPMIEDLAKSLSVPIKVYTTIYELIDDVKDLLEGTATSEEAKIRGRAKVLKVFKLESGDIVAGCRVLAGAIKEDSKVAIYDKDPADLTKNDQPLYTGIVRKLKKGKEEVSVAGKDTDCGILLKPAYIDIKEGLFIETI